MSDKSTPTLWIVFLSDADRTELYQVAVLGVDGDNANPEDVAVMAGVMLNEHNSDHPKDALVSVAPAYEALAKAEEAGASEMVEIIGDAIDFATSTPPQMVREIA